MRTLMIMLILVGCGEGTPDPWASDSAGSDSTGGPDASASDADSGMATDSAGPTDPDSGSESGSEEGSGSEGGSEGESGSESESGPGVEASAEDDYLVIAQNSLPAELDVLANDAGDGLEIDSVDAETARGAAILMEDGVPTYNAQPWIVGEDHFEYVVRDSEGGQSTATAHVIVRPTNMALAHVGAGYQGFAFAAENIGDGAGSSVAGNADLDDDNVPDLVVGAFTADPNGGASGRTYVLSGPAGQGTDTLDGSGFTIDGEATADLSGEATAIAGDVNGDGITDVIVGARGSDHSGSDSGRAYVVFGGAGLDTVELSDVAAGNGGFAIDAPSSGDLCGLGVAGAGDVNGDGLDDVIVGCPDASYESDEVGVAFVVFGKEDGDAVVLADVAAGIGGYALIGEDDGDRSGFSVAGAGDIDGDGFDDVIVGALHATSGGRAYVVHGKDTTEAVLLADVTAGTGGFAIEGAAFGDRVGFSVAGGGDVDGDDRPDIVVGGVGGDVAYVVFGKAGTELVDLAALGSAGFAMTGASGDDTGDAVAMAGDVDGDGLVDILVGAPSSDALAGDAGRGYLVYGKADNETVDLAGLATADGTQGFTLEGANASYFAGTSVAPAGDLNGDGHADLVVGSTGTPAGGTAYVFYGVRKDW